MVDVGLPLRDGATKTYTQSALHEPATKIRIVMSVRKLCGGRGHPLKTKECIMNRRITISFIAAVIAASSPAQAQTNLPGVTVTADGWPILCAGSDCAYLIDTWKNPRTNQTPMGGGGSISLTHDEFCEKLENRAPDQCDAEDPPSVPFVDPGWEGNGCGTGGWADSLITILAHQYGTSGFTGNLDEPMDGVSFLNACNDHDQCYFGTPIGTRSKSYCDNTLFEALGSVCAAAASYQQSNCEDIAFQYRGALGTAASDEAWEEDHDAMICALYAKDMDRNGCES